MERSGERICNFLPSDEELMRREKIFLDLFDKYNIDEGSDPELAEDDNQSTVSDESRSGSDSSFSEASGCEDNIDVAEMNNQLQPFINDRVNGWAAKGINFQLKTVDRGVTVEEWLEANQEFTTTTKKCEKTVINEANKTTTITTTQTKTTTTRTSVNMRRNNGHIAQMRAIASGELVNGETSIKRSDVGNEMETAEQNYMSSDLLSSNRFEKPKGSQKQSTPGRLKQKRKAASPKIKRLSPRKMKLRNRKRSAKSESKSTQPDSGFFSNDISMDIRTGISSELSDDVFNEVSKPTSNKVSNEIFGDGGVRGDHESQFDNNAATEQTESDSPREKEGPQSQISTGGLSKTRPPEIVVYSPSAGKKFGTKINDEFMSVTRNDFKKGIDRKWHQYTNFSLIKKCVVPVKQRLVYAPPIDMATDKNSNNDDSETDDDLLTSYTTSGRFYRTNFQ